MLLLCTERFFCMPRAIQCQSPYIPDVQSGKPSWRQVVICALHLQGMQEKLYSVEAEERLRNQVIEEINVLLQMEERGRAVLPHLEMSIVNRACSNPGAVVVEKLLLPLIQERLERLACQHTAEKALEAQENLLEAEVGKDIMNPLLSFCPVVLAEGMEKGKPHPCMIYVHSAFCHGLCFFALCKALRVGTGVACYSQTLEIPQKSFKESQEEKQEMAEDSEQNKRAEEQETADKEKLIKEIMKLRAESAQAKT